MTEHDLTGQQPTPAPDGSTAVAGTVAEILTQVDEIRQAVGDDFDLSALGRQTELLEQAHDALTAALEDVDPR